jgi:hypothetical protein
VFDPTPKASRGGFFNLLDNPDHHRSFISGW